ILALYVLAILNLSGIEVSQSNWGISLAIGGAGLAFLASIAWGLGLPRLAIPLSSLIVAVSGASLVLASRSPTLSLWIFNGFGRAASAGLMGAALTSMLLGHHYLTAPSMSISPLRRLVRITGVALVLRSLLALAALWLWYDPDLISINRLSTGRNV